MSNSENFASREVAYLTILDYATQKPYMTLDFANVVTSELTGTPVYAYGGAGHPKRISFSGERGGTLTIETQIQTMKLHSMISGAALTTSANFIKKELVKCVSAGVLVTTGTPIAGTINVFDDEDDCGTPIVGTLNTKTFTATTASDIVLNASYYVYYMEALSGTVKKLAIKSTTFPSSFTIFGETTMKTEDDLVEAYKFIAYKVAPEPSMSLNFSNTGDPVTLTIKCEMMADENDNFMDLIQVEDAENAAVTYTLTYNKNAGGASGTMTDGASPYNAGDTVTLLTNSFTPDTGYVFDSWCTAPTTDAPGAITYDEGHTFVIGANTVIYAIWALS